MSKVKEVAQQIANALPEDADFSDLGEFIWERAEVEQGRDDCEAGRTCSLAEVLPNVKHVTAPTRVEWSQHAANALTEFTESLRSAPSAISVSVESAVSTAIQTVIESLESGVNLPEMGDASILEVHLRVSHGITCRIIYDVRGDVARVLWFTNNTTCYRNVKGPVAAT